jgi:iron complex outermembrane receptor protein
MAGSTIFTTRRAPLRAPLAISLSFAWAAALAQAPAPSASASSSPPAMHAAAASTPAASALAPVTITGKTAAPASVAGWGDIPLAQTPVQAAIVDAKQLRDAGADRLADLVRFDAAVTDAYNAEGYIDYFTVRGFVIDNRFNFRRDDLPINAETSIPLDNKARVDVLEGISGIVAGTSSPGGLIDVIVKRPLDVPLSSAFVQWREKNSVLGSVDISRRFGPDNQFGLRFNAAAEHIDPYVRDDVGNRTLLALAGDWRLGASTLIEAEAEQSHRSQPSVPGFSLLGNNVPTPGDPRINLNDQPWSLPTVFDATTASLRITQRLNDDWRLVAHGLTQRLRTDDRTAFPFGCTAADGTYYPDRFCPDGTFDLYDYRSEDEQRHSGTLDLSLHGNFTTGPVGHTLTTGALRNIVHNRFNALTYNFAGTGNVEGTAIVPPAPEARDTNTNRDEYSTELYLRDAIALDTRTTLWLGARYTRLDRGAVNTDGSSPTRYTQSFTTPFAAATYAMWPGQIAYASWGQSVQSDVAPNLPRYTNAGQAAPAAKSRQSEIGFKGGGEQLVEWTVAAFDVEQPLFGDLGLCVAGPGDPPDCTHTLVGDQHHIGLEASGTWRQGPWELSGGAQWLHARVEGQADESLNGKRPTNVPALSARLAASYYVVAVPGLALQGAASYESSREVLPDNSISIPSVTRFDLGARLERRISGVAWTLRAGVDNVFDRRAWRESPFEFSHVYLFPLAPRTFRASLQADL